MAAILSCALSYECIAKKILAEYPAADKHRVLREWVSGYASDSYHEDNEVLADLMNRLTEDYSEKRKQHLVDIFTACSRYEAAFWDMAWEMRHRMLKFDNVSFQYDVEDFSIIDHLSFDVQDGEFVSVIGASGCGKSTIFRLVNKLLLPASGEILVDGEIH